MAFSGIQDGYYDLLAELCLRNDKAFYEAAKPRFREAVLRPLQELVEALTPTVLGIDPAFGVRPNMGYAISRVMRDARRVRGGSFYRDHMWICFKIPAQETYTYPAFYCEFEQDGWGYGMGFYAPGADVMHELRQLLLEDPQRGAEALESARKAGFVPMGERYRRLPAGEPDARVLPLFELKSCFFAKETPGREGVTDPALPQRIARDYEALTPMYRLMKEAVVRAMIGKGEQMSW